jgi:drug/metabolite transporter (DMT)-like permease
LTAAVGSARPALGIAAITGAAACFAAMDTTTRYLGAFLAVQLMLWMRYAIHTVVMSAWLALDRDNKTFRTRHLGFQLLRGSLLLCSSTLAFYGLQHLPVAEFTAIVLLTPLLVTLLAGWLLGEHVSPLRWALVAGGFAGALIVIRPGSGLFGWAMLFPFAAAFSNATFQVLSSKYAAHENPYTTNFYTGLTGTLVMTPFLLASGIDADAVLAAAPASQLALLLAIGVLGTAGHLLLVMALGLAPTATLMPFLYTQVAFAALIGWAVFRALPDVWGWLGIAVIAVCGAAGAWLNLRRPVSAVEADTVAD